jgi:hypothetical protein
VNNSLFFKKNMEIRRYKNSLAGFVSFGLSTSSSSDSLPATSAAGFSTLVAAAAEIEIFYHN